MTYSDLCEAFDGLNPYQKAIFIDARLGWATGCGLCSEVYKRICEPLNDEDYA